MPEPTQLKGLKGSELALVGFITAGMFALLVWASYWVFPSGKTWTVGEFILVWLKEIIMVCVGVIAILSIAVHKLLESIRSHQSRKRSTL